MQLCSYMRSLQACRYSSPEHNAHRIVFHTRPVHDNSIDSKNISRRKSLSARRKEAVGQTDGQVTFAYTIFFGVR